MKRVKHDLPPISDEEEARIQAGIAQDPDNPELTQGEIAAMRPAAEVLPPELYAALTKLQPDRAAPQAASAEEQVAIHLDRAVLDHFRAAGPGWESRINETLKRAIRAERSPALSAEDR